MCIVQELYYNKEIKEMRVKLGHYVIKCKKYMFHKQFFLIVSYRQTLKTRLEIILFMH